MIYFWAIAAYLIFLIFVGAYRSRMVKTSSDFMVAGRRLTTPILIGTLLATWIGSGSIIAGGEFSYKNGFAGLWMPAGAWAGIVILYFISGRARRLAQFTVPDILELRYNKYARILGTITTIIAYTAIVSYQFRAGGFVLNLVVGIPESQGILITAVFVILYTALAGMISVAYTDVVNGLVILIGILIGFPYLLNHAGGWSVVQANLPADHFTILGSMSFLQVLGYFLPTMFLLLGESNMYQRFFSARDEGSAKRAVIGWTIGTIVIETMIVAMAVVGSSLYKDILPETVIIHAARYGLPTILGCLLLATIVAVIVSTADSFLLVPATNIMRDIYQRFINPNLSERKMVIYSRLVVILLGILAFIQVRWFTSVLAMAIYAYTMYGSGITPATVGAFFFKRGTSLGGVTSIALGIGVTIVWEILKHPRGVPTIFPAIGASILGLVVVSLLTPKPAEEKIAPFFSNMKE
jgi:SSS family solute:Na+ symporter